MRKKNIKLIALDLDKTLLNDEGKISEDDGQTLGRISKKGIIVTLASGRMTDCVQPFADTLGIDAPIIAYNGAMVRDSKKNGFNILFHSPLQNSYADSIIDYADKNKFQLNYYLDDVLYSLDIPELKKYSKLYSDQTGAKYHFVPDLTEFKGKNPTKLIVITEPSIRDKLYLEFKNKYDDVVNITKTNPEYLEFMNKEADKSIGLSALVKAYNIDMEEVMAFGDGDNDLTMVEKAGIGVTVSNAGDRIKDKADYITKSTNNESPVTEAIGFFEVA